MANASSSSKAGIVEGLRAHWGKDAVRKDLVGGVAYRWKALGGTYADGFTVRWADGSRESHPFAIDWSKDYPF